MEKKLADVSKCVSRFSYHLALQLKVTDPFQALSQKLKRVKRTTARLQRIVQCFENSMLILPNDGMDSNFLLQSVSFHC